MPSVKFHAISFAKLRQLQLTNHRLPSSMWTSVFLFTFFYYCTSSCHSFIPVCLSAREYIICLFAAFTLAHVCFCFAFNARGNNCNLYIIYISRSLSSRVRMCAPVTTNPCTNCITDSLQQLTLCRVECIWISYRVGLNKVMLSIWWWWWRDVCALYEWESTAKWIIIAANNLHKMNTTEWRGKKTKTKQYEEEEISEK